MFARILFVVFVVLATMVLRSSSLPIAFDAISTLSPVMDVTEHTEIIDDDDFEPFSLLAVGDTRFDLLEITDLKGPVPKPRKVSKGKWVNANREPASKEDKIIREMRISKIKSPRTPTQTPSEEENQKESPEKGQESGKNKGNFTKGYDVNGNVAFPVSEPVKDPKAGEEPALTLPPESMPQTHIIIEEINEKYEIDPAHPFVVPFAGEHSFRKSLKSRIQTSRRNEKLASRESRSKHIPPHARDARMRSGSPTGTVIDRRRASEPTPTGVDSRSPTQVPADESSRFASGKPTGISTGAGRSALKIPRYLQTREGMETMRTSLDAIIDEIRYYFEKVGGLFGEAENTILDVDDMLSNFASQNSNLYQRYETDPLPHHWAADGADAGYEWM